MESLHEIGTVIGRRTLITFLSLVLLSVLCSIDLSTDVSGQGKILDSNMTSNLSPSNEINITINGANLKADLALSANEQAKGLSVKDALNPDEGMLFPYDSPRTLSFWMKDMKFPIDILWLNADKEVVHIEENLQPCSPFLPCPSYSPDVQAQYVLETVAGFSSANGIIEGTPVLFDLP
ncbi:MAG TPA: DUF192 domain-containing protein [Nitrososphaeraceae archaeon]|nr:DUF192 domain-containing protein [Nitrososphaeraceae archaeon]